MSTRQTRQRQVMFALSIFLVTGGGSLGFVGELARAQGTSEEKPSPELLALGKELFNTKGPLAVKYACILCHQKEKAVKRAEVIRLGEQLPDVINRYLVEKAKGKSLAKDSQEMKALVAYITHEHSI